MLFRADFNKHAQPPAAHRRRLRPSCAASPSTLRRPDGPARHQPSVPRDPHGRLRRLSGRLRDRLLGGAGAAVGRARERPPRRWEILPEQAKSCIIAWVPGHQSAGIRVDAVREMQRPHSWRGQIAAKGAGPCPIRGPGNVQGNRTCGVDHRPTEVAGAPGRPCGITSPRAHGLDTVQNDQRPCIAATSRWFLGMGGNFALATPDREFYLRGPPPLRLDRPCRDQAQPQPPGPWRQAVSYRARPHRKDVGSALVSAGHGRDSMSWSTSPRG